MNRRKRDYSITTQPDDLPTNNVGPWAEQKHRYVGMYAELFATGMKNRWKRRVYLDLFSGSGHSRLRGTTRVVLGSPLVALSLPDLYDAYIFSDEDPAVVEALKARVAKMGLSERCSFIPGDVNAKVDEICARIPGPTAARTLSFCFLDPFKLNIRFETVRRLAEGRDIDFLILLALYVDANRNIQSYVREGDSTIELFLGNPAWRERWKEAERGGQMIVTFLADAYSSKMLSIGYLPMPLDQMVKIRSSDRNLPLYYLAFFSRHKTGMKFWGEVLKYANEQLQLPFDDG
jgi:three-Cys-motif partner protein